MIVVRAKKAVEGGRMRFEGVTNFWRRFANGGCVQQAVPPLHALCVWMQAASPPHIRAGTAGHACMRRAGAGPAGCTLWGPCRAHAARMRPAQ